MKYLYEKYFLSLGKIPRSGIGNSHDKCFNFAHPAKLHFQSVCTILRSEQQYKRVLFVLSPHQYLVLSIFVNVAHPVNFGNISECLKFPLLWLQIILSLLQRAYRIFINLLWMSFQVFFTLLKACWFYYWVYWIIYILCLKFFCLIYELWVSLSLSLFLFSGVFEE